MVANTPCPFEGNHGCCTALQAAETSGCCGLGPLTAQRLRAGQKVEQRPGQEWIVFRSDGGTLKANETLRFAIGNLPERNKNAEYALLGVSILIILVVLFGFRRETTEGGARLSLGHLEAERDRLIKALARMRKAHEKGRMSDARFTREQEAITARLVSLYRAIDRLTVS